MASHLPVLLSMWPVGLQESNLIFFTWYWLPRKECSNRASLNVSVFNKPACITMPANVPLAKGGHMVKSRLNVDGNYICAGIPRDAFC